MHEKVNECNRDFAPLTSKVACKKLAYLPAEKARIANSARIDPIKTFGLRVVFYPPFPTSSVEGSLLWRETQEDV